MQASTHHDRHAALIAEIQARHAQFSPQFQAGARYLVDHSGDVAVSPMRSIATRQGLGTCAP